MLNKSAPRIRDRILFQLHSFRKRCSAVSNAGIPVIAGFAYKYSGHICIIVGHDPANKVWLVHDPYGTRHGASDNYDIGIGGAFDPYSYDTMQRIFWDQGGEAGWGRIVTSIKGKTTGLPTGL